MRAATRVIRRAAPAPSLSLRGARALASTSSSTSRTPAPENYSSDKGYRGPLKAAILDWSGTCADNYVIAPAYAFVEVFNKFKVPITMAEARGPMGLRKDLHIEALTKVPAIAERWKKQHGRAPGSEDVAAMFKDFVPMQMACLPRFTGLIPGCKEAVDALRSEYKLKIGNTTGFQRVMVDVLLKDAAKQGYVPDCSVAGDEVDKPRPWPWMVFENLRKLEIKPVHAVVKVDDTVSGVQEGLNAGTWAVGLAATSNYMDIDSVEHRNSLSDAEFERRVQKSFDILKTSGAHYVVRDIRELPDVVAKINKRLLAGERP